MNRSPTAWWIARSVRSARRSTAAATTSLTSCEPSEPQVTPTTKRPSGRSSAARAAGALGGPVEVDDRLAHRRPGDLGVRQRRALERHGDGAGTAGEQPGDEPGAQVVADDHDGRARQPGGERRREAGVPADVDDHLRVQPADEPAGLPRRLHQAGQEHQVARRQAALQAGDVEQGHRVTRRRDEALLDAVGRADVVDLVHGMPPRHQSLGDRQRREHMTGRATAGHDRVCHHRSTARRAPKRSGGGEHGRRREPLCGDRSTII